MKNQIASIFVILVLSIIIAGCVLPPQPTPNITKNTTNLTPVCDKNCFISVANNCENASMLFTNEVGTFNYSTSDCVFTKTLITLNSTETEEMKNLLQGKSMTCRYEKGKFDQRLATSLIFGMEYCEGDLKEALAQLIIFS